MSPTPFHELCLVLGKNTAFVAVVDLDAIFLLDVHGHFRQNSGVHSHLEPDVVLSLIAAVSALQTVHGSLLAFHELEEIFFNERLLAVDLFIVLLVAGFTDCGECILQFFILQFFILHGVTSCCWSIMW